MNKLLQWNRIWILAAVLMVVLATSGCLFGGTKPAVTPTPAAGQGGGIIVTKIAATNTQPAKAPGASPTPQAAVEASPTPQPEPTSTAEAPTATPTAAVEVTATPTTVEPATEGVYEPIPGCAKSRLHWGDVIRVVTKVEYVRIRSTADTRPSDNVVRKLYRTELAQTTGLPRCNYGWIIWPIRTADGTTGWVPESNGIDFWFDKVEGAFFPTPTEPSR